MNFYFDNKMLPLLIFRFQLPILLAEALIRVQDLLTTEIVLINDLTVTTGAIILLLLMARASPVRFVRSQVTQQKLVDGQSSTQVSPAPLASTESSSQEIVATQALPGWATDQTLGSNSGTTSSIPLQRSSGSKNMNTSLFPFLVEMKSGRKTLATSSEGSSLKPTAGKLADARRWEACRDTPYEQQVSLT
ncbi:protocadherin-16-like protein [Corchorus olitorius]|uniref:Protocadherin-16-like protein n=1 Tax=Corchorus olitorius TaxID=93759 RepID=A0A1R3J5P3_9ROSI|nr:protocadherin-16-like protein [Corchorus olitorius]